MGGGIALHDPLEWGRGGGWLHLIFIDLENHMYLLIILPCLKTQFFRLLIILRQSFVTLFKILMDELVLNHKHHLSLQS